MNKHMLRTFLFIGLIAAIFACDEDDNVIGNSIISDEDFALDTINYPVTVRNVVLPPVQTNRLPVYKLGFYDDPIYGLQEYDLVTQLALDFVNPDFGEEIVLDSVVLDIPLFSRVTAGTMNDFEYELDSVYNNDGTLDLKIYENGYFLGDIDPDNVTEPAIYYSDFGNIINQQKEALIYADTVKFSPEPVRLMSEDANGEEVVSEVLAPRIRLNLDLPYWEEKIFYYAIMNYCQIATIREMRMTIFIIRLPMCSPSGMPYSYVTLLRHILIYESFKISNLSFRFREIKTFAIVNCYTRTIVSSVFQSFKTI